MPANPVNNPATFAALVKMHQAADSFYALAQRTGVHTFLEFTGFIREYIKLCEQAVEKGIDFTTEELPIRAYHAGYIGEKLKCIFGDQLVVTFNPNAKAGH
jgi:hypothetical protein